MTKFFYYILHPITWEIGYSIINYDMLSCWHMTQKAQVAWNFNCLIETEKLLNVTGSHVDCKSDSITEMVPDRDTVTTDHP